MEHMTASTTQNDLFFSSAPMYVFSFYPPNSEMELPDDRLHVRSAQHFLLCSEARRYLRIFEDPTPDVFILFVLVIPSQLLDFLVEDKKSTESTENER